MNRVLFYLGIYEVAKDFYEQAKQKNSEEQLAFIQPLYEKAFPQYGKYEDRWQIDDEEVDKWETELRISDICQEIAMKHCPAIEAERKSFLEAELMLVNSAMDLLSQSGNLSQENLDILRERVNQKGYSREREKIIEFLVDSAKKKRDEFARRK